MRRYIKKHLFLLPFEIGVIVCLFWVIFIYDAPIKRLFITADQEGYNAYKKQSYALSATLFEDISLKGASYYKEGAFKKAKSLYQTLSTKEATYNLGNVFVMLGEYDDAIKSYQRALEIDPNFKEAKENLVVAKARKILKEPENDGKQGIGDMYDMQPDEVVYDNTEGKGEDDTRSADKDTAKGNPNWLDRLQTTPKDFLKNKFRYQYEMGKRSDEK